MMRVAITLSALLLIGRIVLAGSAGTTGFELLRTDGSARNTALGGSQIAVGGGLHSLYANPAGLAAIETAQGAVGFFKHVMDINSGSLAFAKPVTGLGTVGVGITYFDYGTFDRASEFGQKEGEFGASDVLLTVSAAREVAQDLNGGVSLKYLHSTIDSYTASALAADIGIIYKTGFNKWDVGAGIHNIGFATAAFLEEREDLPASYRLGFSVPLEHLPVRFSFAGDYMEAEGIRGCGGLEITFSQYLMGRLGYNTTGIDQRVGLDRDALAGFSGGLGIHINKLSVDYSMTSQGEIGYLHRFTISSEFPKFR